MASLWWAIISCCQVGWEPRHSLHKRGPFRRLPASEIKLFTFIRIVDMIDLYYNILYIYIYIQLVYLFGQTAWPAENTQPAEPWLRTASCQAQVLGKWRPAESSWANTWTTRTTEREKQDAWREWNRLVWIRRLGDHSSARSVIRLDCGESFFLKPLGLPIVFCMATALTSLTAHFPGCSQVAMISTPAQ